MDSAKKHSFWLLKLSKDEDLSYLQNTTKFRAFTVEDTFHDQGKELQRVYIETCQRQRQAFFQKLFPNNYGISGISKKRSTSFVRSRHWKVTIPKPSSMVVKQWKGSGNICSVHVLSTSSEGVSTLHIECPNKVRESTLKRIMEGCITLTPTGQSNFINESVSEVMSNTDNNLTPTGHWLLTNLDVDTLHYNYSGTVWKIKVVHKKTGLPSYYSYNLKTGWLKSEDVSFYKNYVVDTIVNEVEEQNNKIVPTTHCFKDKKVQSYNPQMDTQTVLLEADCGMGKTSCYIDSLINYHIGVPIPERKIAFVTENRSSLVLLIFVL